AWCVAMSSADGPPCQWCSPCEYAATPPASAATVAAPMRVRLSQWFMMFVLWKIGVGCVRDWGFHARAHYARSRTPEPFPAVSSCFVLFHAGEKGPASARLRIDRQVSDGAGNFCGTVPPHKHRPRESRGHSEEEILAKRAGAPPTIIDVAKQAGVSIKTV